MSSNAYNSLLSGGGVAIAVNLIVAVSKHYGYDLTGQQDTITEIITASVGLATLIGGLISHLHTKAQQTATTVAVAQESQNVSIDAGVKTPPLASSILQQQPVPALSQRINSNIGK